jgi:hypothetical protein
MKGAETMSRVGYTPQVGAGGNASGQTVRKRKRKKDRCAQIPPDERRQLRDSGQARNDYAIFRARADIAERYPRKYHNADDVTAAVLNNTIPKAHLSLLLQLREKYLSE